MNMIMLAAFVVLLIGTQVFSMIRLELTMGRDIPNEGHVTDFMMDDFIRLNIMPLFEYGTFIDGFGIWKGVREECKIFYLDCMDSEVDEMLLNMNCCAAAYKKAFRQDSVMVSQVQTQTAFT